MFWTGADSRRSRAATIELIEQAEEGIIDWEVLARTALNWMGDAEVREFAEVNGFLEEEEDTDEE